MEEKENQGVGRKRLLEARKSKKHAFRLYDVEFTDDKAGRDLAAELVEQDVLPQGATEAVGYFRVEAVDHEGVIWRLAFCLGQAEARREFEDFIFELTRPNPNG